MNWPAKTSHGPIQRRKGMKGVEQMMLFFDSIKCLQTYYSLIFYKGWANKIFFLFFRKQSENHFPYSTIIEKPHRRGGVN